MNISLLGVFRRDLVCQQVVEIVTAYLEDALSRSDRRRLEKHLSGCPLCTEYLAQIRETIRLAGRLAPEDLSPEMRSDLTEVYRRWLADG
jgi:anti-sigma factor RsiW